MKTKLWFNETNNEQLLKYLDKQLKETIDELKWCETHPNPQTESEIEGLKFRKAWLQSQIDELMYPIN